MKTSIANQDIASEINNFLGNFLYKETQPDLFFKPIKSIADNQFIFISNQKIPFYINEFWTAKQRKSSSIHEISYRACFKAELPNFFISLLTKPDDIIYDPFAGRGTTIIEAALMGRKIIANDINPLSKIISKPRLNIPKLSDVKNRLDKIEFKSDWSCDIDLSMFYEDKTLQEILSLKNYLADKKNKNQEDEIDEWIRMVATNRLTGHSSGFFSVYTMPPNQAISAKKQAEINLKHNRKPEYRDVKKIILKKSASLIKDLTIEQIKNLKSVSKDAIFLSENSSSTKQIKANLVDLIITSPPFLDVINYAADNWLRCWFNDIDIENLTKKISTPSKIEDWCDFNKKSFVEFRRILKPQGYVAFEVGEVRGGKIKLEEYVAPIAIELGFKCVAIIINSQKFTKTANLWGVDNNKKGTNSNRILLLQKI
jgi:DNA modification methylase